MKFSLHAISKSGKVGKSSIWVQFNQPPKGGTFTVTPTVGFSLITEFQLLASQWYDEEYTLSQLQYSFSYRLQDCQISSCEKLLSTFSSKNKFSTILPPGNLTFILGIKDETGASCPVSTQVFARVLPFWISRREFFPDRASWMSRSVREI